MIGIGTIINTSAVILGSLIGLCIKKGLKDRVKQTIIKSCGLAIIIIGIAGSLEGMLVVSNGKISAGGSMLLVISLVLGGFVGEMINIERLLDRFGEWLKKKAHRQNDISFSEGFINASLVICTGAMAIVGSMKDGISGDYSMLLAKSVLDFIIVMIFASNSGIGVMFSAIPIFFYQGAITLAAFAIHGLVNETLICNMSYIGSVLIAAVGINLLFGKKINVGNLLPALVVPIIYQSLQLFLPI